MRIYMDESGYTGQDLVTQEQPVFTLASTDLDDGLSAEIRQGVFGRVNARELKHSQLVKSARGRAMVIDFIRSIQNKKDRFATCLAHKEYALLGKLVDIWVEPPMQLAGGARQDCEMRIYHQATRR